MLPADFTHMNTAIFYCSKVAGSYIIFLIMCNKRGGFLLTPILNNLNQNKMSRTTDWYLEMLEDGTLAIFQSVVEDIDYELVEEVKIEENDN